MMTDQDKALTQAADLYVPFERGGKPESIRLSTILDAIKSNPRLLQVTRDALQSASATVT